MQKIIGLTGKLGAGKDTVASFMETSGFKRIAFSDALYKEVCDAYNVSAAFLQNRETKESALPELALKNCSDREFAFIAAYAFMREDKARGIAPEIASSVPRSPRRIMQVWGTEYRRKTMACSDLHSNARSDSYWRDKVTRAIRSQPDENFVVTDVRFPDEANDLMALGGKIVRVVMDFDKFCIPNDILNLPTTIRHHSSETAMDTFPVSAKLSNHRGDEGLARLEKQTIDMINNIFSDDEECGSVQKNRESLRM